MRADFLTKSPQQKLSDIGPKGSKKVKNCTKLVHFFTRDGRLRSKWTLFTLFGHYFKNTHSRHCPLKPIRIPTCGDLWDSVGIPWEYVGNLSGFIMKAYLSIFHCTHNPVVYCSLLHILYFSPTMIIIRNRYSTCTYYWCTFFPVGFCGNSHRNGMGWKWRLKFHSHGNPD